MAQDVLTYETDAEKELRLQLVKKLKEAPIPDDQLLSNLGLFLDSKSLSRILFMNYLYSKIIDVQGVIFDFGTRWGQNMALFSSLRGVYEPFNRHRKIIGFDTFTGFPAISYLDGHSSMMQVGQLSVGENYDAYLSEVLSIHDHLGPLSHVQKFDIRKGDAFVELDQYLIQFPETIVAMAYFDFDLFNPTLHCLSMIKNRLTKGSVLGFDELNDTDSPGETLALMRVFDLNKIAIRRFPGTSRVSYFIVE